MSVFSGTGGQETKIQFLGGLGTRVDTRVTKGGGKSLPSDQG